MNKRSGIKSRKRILSAAMDVFSRKGYAAANIREIAKASRISVGGVYLYFKNKEDLYKCLIEEKRQDFSNTIELTLKQARNNTEALSSFIEFYHEYAVKHKEFILLHIREHGFTFGLEEKKQFFRQQTKQIEKIIKNGIVAGEFNVCNAKDMGKIIMGSLRGVILSIALDEEYVISKDVLKTFLLKSLLKEEGSYNAQR